MSLPSSLPIALVEPQMQDVHHAPFNAALLHAVCLAWPETPISFRAFAAHEHVVRSLLEQHAPGLAERIEWRRLPAQTSASLPSRWRIAGHMLTQVLEPAERVLFCSISRMQLLRLKRKMRASHVVRAVFHGDLDLLDSPPASRFPLTLLSLQSILRRPNPPGFRPILLGESIQRSIPPEFQAAFAQAGIIDHPYHFPPPAFAAPPTSLTFGTFGNTGDALMLEQTARAVRAANPSIHFRLVGFVGSEAVVTRIQDVVENAVATPISRAAFNQQAEGLTHALWLAGANGFRLRASGTFFDALAFLKPLVYTANPYIDAYYTQEPSIGIRCPSAADVPAAILQLAATQTPQTYRAAQEGILRLRERFTPAALALRLPAELAW